MVSRTLRSATCLPLTLALGLVLVTAMEASMPAARAAGIEGTWLDEKGDGHIEIGPCRDGGGLCGRVVWLREPLTEEGEVKTDHNNPDPALRDQPIIGLEIFRFEREQDREGVWTGGTIYDPNNGKTYRCTLRLDGPDTLRLRGYVGIKLFGRTSKWTRLPDGTPPAGRP